MRKKIDGMGVLANAVVLLLNLNKGDVRQSLNENNIKNHVDLYYKHYNLANRGLNQFISDIATMYRKKLGRDDVKLKHIIY